LELATVMLTITRNAVTVLKTAKEANDAKDNAGIRIRRDVNSNNSGMIAIGLVISDSPYPGDEEFEQDGLRIFVENALIDSLDGRTLDVREASEGPELVFR
jgi:Fe-S cluster assembly iron-binding protein IscA